MAADREAAYAALAARLQAKVRSLLACDVRRRLPGYGELDPAMQPALCVVAANDTARDDYPLPQLETCQAVAVVFARADADPNASAESTLTVIVREIARALERQPGDWGGFQSQTDLGGVVVYARPGAVQYSSGQTEQQGIAQLPIEMMLRPT
jgi:hypothetical protein